MNGTVDTSSFTYTGTSLGFSYTNGGILGTGVIDFSGSGPTSSSQDYIGAAAQGMQLASPWVDAGFEALRAFGYIVAPPAMAAADYLAGAPGTSKTGVALAVLPDAFAAGEIAKIAAGMKPAAEGPELQGVINQLYRDKDLLPGGTAGAVRYERSTGNLLSPSGHIPKAQQRITQLTRLLSSGKLSPNDAAIARALIDDLKGAIK